MHRSLVLAAALGGWVFIGLAPVAWASGATPRDRGGADSAEVAAEARAADVAALAEDVDSVQVEVRALRRSVAETLAALRARSADDLPQPLSPSAMDQLDRQAELEQLAERIERLGDEQTRLAERIETLTAGGRADHASEGAGGDRLVLDAAQSDAAATGDTAPARASADLERSRLTYLDALRDEPSDGSYEAVDAKYTRYSGGYTSGTYYVRTEPDRTVGPAVDVDRRYAYGHGYGYRYGDGYAYRSHGGLVYIGNDALVHRRLIYSPYLYRHGYHVGRIYRDHPWFRTDHWRHTHYRRSGVVVGARDGDFFFKLRLGGGLIITD